jgi:hypothetical protein
MREVLLIFNVPSEWCDTLYPQYLRQVGHERVYEQEGSVGHRRLRGSASELSPDQFTQQFAIFYSLGQLLSSPLFSSSSSPLGQVHSPRPDLVTFNILNSVWHPRVEPNRTGSKQL